MLLQNVAIAGATGNMGKPILHALQTANQFNITVLTRPGSQPNLDKDIKTIEVDYDSIDSLVAALRGQEAVISALGQGAVAQELNLIKASARAGVKRIIPAQYGSDSKNVNAAKLPIFEGKQKIERRVEELAAQNGLTYTYIFSGPALDMALAYGYLGVNLKTKQANFLDGGNGVFSTASCADVAKAVVGVLRHPGETANRAVRVQSTAASQRDLLRLSKEALGGEGWAEVDDGSISELERSTWEQVAKDGNSMTTFVSFCLVAILREGYGGFYDAASLDNELLGVAQLKESDIVELVRDASKV